MSKDNRSLNELQQNIYDDFHIRRNELYYLKELTQIKSSSIESQILAKNLILNLYAHWEGFIKYSSECLIQFASHQGLFNNQINHGLLAISNLDILNDLIESKVLLKVKAVETLLNNYNKKAKIPSNYIISTYSNLNTETLEEICLIIGIDETKYSLKKGIIDQQLLRPRNQIAHGNLIQVSVVDTLELYNRIIDIMNEFKVDILNRAVLLPK